MTGKVKVIISNEQNEIRINKAGDWAGFVFTFLQ